MRGVEDLRHWLDAQSKDALEPLGRGRFARLDQAEAKSRLGSAAARAMFLAALPECGVEEVRRLLSADSMHRPEQRLSLAIHQLRLGPSPLDLPPLSVAGVDWPSLPLNPLEPLLRPEGEPGPAAGLAMRDQIARQVWPCQDDAEAEETRLRLALSVRLADGPASLGPWPDLMRSVAVAPSPEPPAEGQRCEFKSAYEYDPRRKSRSGDLRHGCLKTVAAFLNSGGGELWIGIGDDGAWIGLEGDLSLISDPRPLDTFEQRLREHLRRGLEPPPLGQVEIDFPSRRGCRVCRLSVAGLAGETWLIRKDPSTGERVWELYVRDGNRTLLMQARKSPPDREGQEG